MQSHGLDIGCAATYWSLHRRHHFVADLDAPLFTHHRGTLIVDIMCCPIKHVSSITSRVDLLGGAGVYGPLQWRIERDIKSSVLPTMSEGQWCSIYPCYPPCNGLISSHTLHITAQRPNADIVGCRVKSSISLPLSGCLIPSLQLTCCGCKRLSCPQIIWCQGLHNNILFKNRTTPIEYRREAVDMLIWYDTYQQIISQEYGWIGW